MGDLVYKSNGVNSYLLYELTEDDQLDTVSLTMLTHNHIDGVVSMQYRQMDSSKQLLFDVSGKASVSDLLQSILNPMALLHVLRGIAVGLISAEEYRLLEQSLVVTQECIFVDLKSFETSILCLPLKNLPDVEFSLRDTLREIMYHAKYNEEEGSEQIAKTINYLNSETRVNPVKFKEFLDDCLADKPAQKTPPVSEYIKAEPHRTEPEHQSTSIVINQPEAAVPPAEMAEENNPLKKFFGLSKKTDKSAHKKIKVKNQKRSEKKAAKKPATDLGFDFDFPGQEDAMAGFCEEPVISPAPFEQSAPAKQPEHIDYGTTVLITNHDGGRGGMGGSMLQPHLIWQKTSEKINIDRDPFCIGRKASDVDYCIRNNKTVGRIHAEITSKDGEFYVKDLNSANHTYLNGKEISPMTEIPLTHGCKIVFSDEEFEFRLI